MKKFWTAMLATAFLISGSMPVQAEVRIPAVYIALGDSLAAGQTPNSQIDAGYSDLIAQELARHQPVAFYTKNLAFPGFTTEDVLKRIQSPEAKEVLASANIITLSAGANDLLPLIQSNPAEGSLAFQQIQVDFALNKARINLEAIIAELKKTAPQADLYIMGYYFAYPHVRDTQKQGTGKQLDQLNAILKQTSEKAGAQFVSVDQSFGKNAIDKIPNSADVHPNIKGYQAMANAFLEQYQNGWELEDKELPAAAPKTFEEMLQILEQGGEERSATIDGVTSMRPSEKMEVEYLALREVVPYV
ncbi:SGNH/GDSL hydrolase family protein [Planococcus sp. 1R117A]|uniref:SGNH/GDSL hydrolase family protein n=1 Tax=Planococcus sp. 1R117A TaxID=3447020 RepID=UPI003EDC8146